LYNFQSLECGRQVFKSKRYLPDFVIILITISIDEGGKKSPAESKSKPAEEDAAGYAIPGNDIPFRIGKEQLAGSPLYQAADIVEEEKDTGKQLGKKEAQNGGEYIGPGPAVLRFRKKGQQGKNDDDEDGDGPVAAE